MTHPSSLFLFPQPGGIRGAMIGGMVWAGIGAATGRSWGSTAAGGITGGVIETETGAQVKDVYYAMITDVQISERSAAAVSQVMTSDLAQGTQTTIQQEDATCVQ